MMACILIPFHDEDQWILKRLMGDDRWYPTVTSQPFGKILGVSGSAGAKLDLNTPLWRED